MIEWEIGMTSEIIRQVLALTVLFVWP